MLVAAIVLATSTPGTLTLSRAGRSHASLDSASITATMTVQRFGDPTRSVFEIHYSRPDRARIVVDQNPGTGVREIALDRGRSTFFLADLMQYVVADLPPGKSLSERLKSVDDTLEGIVYAVLETDGVSDWMSERMNFNDWTRSKVRGRIVLDHEGPGGTISVQLHPKTFLLTKMELRTDESHLDWSFKYAKSAGSLAFSKPKGSYQIDTFNPSIRPPTYEDKDAKEKTVMLFAAYDELTKFAYEVSSEGATVSIWINGNDMRQLDDTLDWSYDGTTLLVHVLETGLYYSAKLTFREVIDVIVVLGSWVEPHASMIVTSTNPYRKMLGSGQSVRVTGSLKIDGADCTMLAAERQGLEINLIVRNDTGMVLSSHTIDRTSGPPRILGEQSFQYLPAPSIASDTRIQAPAGTEWSDATTLLSQTR